MQVEKNEYFYTGTIRAHGHLWKLRVMPRRKISYNYDDEHVSISLVYADENSNTDPVVVAKTWIRTKTSNHEIPRHAFTKENSTSVYRNYSTRKDIIENDCNEAGTLTITLEIQVTTEKRSAWYPQLTSSSDTNNDIGTQLYNRTEYSDITFMIGQSKEEFYGHKCVLSVRARDLCELVVTEEESSSSSNNNCIVVLADVDEKAFREVFKFIYTGEVPKLKNDDDDDDDNENTIKSILRTANRFGVTELKLHMESILVDKFLIPSKAAGLLLFADSYICPLLKEESMNEFMTDSTAFMNSQDDWKKVQASPKLLTELLLYTHYGRTRYTPITINDGESSNGDDDTLDDVVDDFDVTSLRERLQMVNLTVDGSREMLVLRWKDYIRANDTGVW